MYAGLKHVGVETQLVTYPRELHGFRERAHREDVIRRMIAWFDRHLSR